EELPTQWEFNLALPMRAEPIVPHPLEAPRQDMQEPAPEEFNSVERHGALTIPSWVTLPPEGHVAIGTGQEPPIRNGHAMRVAGQVAEDSLRPGQWRVGIGHPPPPPQRRGGF